MYRPDGPCVKVNVGSGLAVAHGWLNVDGSLNAFFSRWPLLLRITYRISGCRVRFTEDEYIRILNGHRFLYHNVLYGLPFPDECIDYVYCSHLLEHLTEKDGEHFLGEAYRVLKKGGVIRLSVPDLAYAVKLYQGGDKPRALELIFSNTESLLYRHSYMYDFDILRQALHGVGFADVDNTGYREGRTPDIELLDNRPEQSLFVEAVKPT